MFSIGRQFSEHLETSSELKTVHVSDVFKTAAKVQSMYSNQEA
jgi:hypothetical protein